MNPYYILGVKETDSNEYIYQTYKSLLIKFHPDRETEFNLPYHEKTDIYNDIIKAYHQIINERNMLKIGGVGEGLKEVGFREVGVGVGVGRQEGFGIIREEIKGFGMIRENFGNDKIKPDFFPELKNFNMDHKARPREEINIEKNQKITKENFNAMFNLKKEEQVKNGTVDPFHFGYDDFKGGQRTVGELSEPVKIPEKGYKRDQGYIDISDPEDPFYPLKTTVTNIDHLNPKNKINDFSGTMQGGVLLTDLQIAYGKDQEYWEDTFQRNKSMSDKYYNKNNLDSLVNQQLNSRSMPFKRQ